MRIPTAESEVGYIRKFSSHSYGAIYSWISKETTYGINYKNTYQDKGREMTWAGFVKHFPYESGWGRIYRSMTPCKRKW